MSRRKASVPGYCLHRASGQAVAYVNRKPVYLGRHNSPESRIEYGRLLARLAAEALPEEAAKPASGRRVLTVAELCLKFVTDELPRYSPSEQHCYRTAIRVLRTLFGETPVTEFGPLRLKVVREAMVNGDATLTDAEGNPRPRRPWSRQTANRQTKRLQAMFRWGTENEIVPVEVATALSLVRVLKAGETAAAESVPRLAVPQASIDAVRNELRQKHRDILDVMLLTGARPGELVGLRMQDIDRTGDVWRAELKAHKTRHKGKRRVLFFNREAQAILLRHFKADPQARVFAARRDNFGAAVRRACLRAGVEPFCPHQLRHTVITKVADELGLEAAQRLAGHSTAAMTEHYSRAADRKAVEAVQRLGTGG